MSRRATKINPGRELALFPDPAVLVRLLSRVVVDKAGPGYAGSACWIWQGYTDPKGYGRASVQGRNEWVHRALYALLRGPIPAGHEWDHGCKNHGCCNPFHGEPVTPLVNRSRANDRRWPHRRQAEALPWAERSEADSDAIEPEAVTTSGVADADADAAPF